MRREDLFMDILGELDDKYIVMAMPRSGGHGLAADAHTVTWSSNTEFGVEISKKDRVIYWVTHSLGVAAAAFLVIGAAVLLIMNWDKIAVNDPDRPGIVTTENTTSITVGTEPSVTSVSDAATTSDTQTSVTSDTTEPDSTTASDTQTSVTSDTTEPDVTQPDEADPFEQITDTNMPAPYADGRNEWNTPDDLSIIVGDRKFTPEWLYYHTAEDYQAAGITRQMIGKMLKKYEGLGLTDEAWKAFREKLILYYTYGVFDEASVDKTYIIDTENCKLSGDSAFEILEKVYYGEWEIKEPFEPYKSVLSLTYQQDPFANGMIPVTGMFETDEIYALAFTNGGAGGCLLIEKNAPDVMYWTDILPSGVGLDVVKFGYGLPGTYINRKPAVPEIKSGELSSLGLKKLFHIYGKAFEDSFAETLEKDRTAGIETGFGKAYSASKDIRFGELPGYLADYTDDSVNMLLPYYCEKDGDVTTFYAVKSFMKNYKGEWDAVDIWTDEGIAPLYGMNDASGTTIPVGMLGEFDLDELTANVFSDNGTFTTELNKFLDGLSDKGLAAQYRKAFALGTAGCRDMEDYENTEVLRQFYGDDYERSGKRAVVYSNSDAGTDDTSGNSWVNAVKDHLDSILSDGSGSILGKSSGYSFTSVMNAYLHTFSASYINDVFPQLPFCRCGDELFYRDASMVIPDCYYEFNLSGGEDRAVIAVMGYAKDKATGEKTDEIIYGIEAIFDKTTDGWKCSRFGFSNRSE